MEYEVVIKNVMQIIVIVSNKTTDKHLEQQDVQFQKDF
jgi:hypothetical protein